MTVDPKYKAVLLEALADMMYKLSMQLDQLKGGPLSKERKEMSAKQTLVEELQRQVSALEP
jgi:hypothetical protein